MTSLGTSTEPDDRSALTGQESCEKAAPDRPRSTSEPSDQPLAILAESIVDLSLDWDLAADSPALALGRSIPPETWETWLGRWLTTLAPADLPLIPAEAIERPPVWQLSLRLTDDCEIQALNAEYRQIDRPTDVLSFAALEGLPPFVLAASLAEGSIELGDLVISVETADRQARDRGHAWLVEMAWLAAHGLLHLLGWDHPDEVRLAEMLDRQRQWLTAIDLAPPEFQ